MTTQISVPASGVNLPVSGLRIEGERRPEIVLDSATAAMSANRHDSAVLTCKVPSREVGALERQPLSFEIGTSPAYTFRGNIYRVEKAQRLQAQVVCKLHCIGITSRAKTPVFGLLRDVTAEGLADRVLPPVGLSYYSSGSTERFPRVALTGRDAWDIVVAGADLSGRRVSSLNGAVWYFDPIAELERRLAAFTFRKSIDSYGSGDRTLLDFIPGSTRPKVSNQDLPRAAWFAPDGSVRTEAPSGDNTYWLQDVYLPTDDYAKAIFAKARKAFTLGETATARVKGVPQIIPGVVVDISTGVVSTLTDTYDGLWVVTDVTHSVVNGSFQTQLGLLRDKYRRASTTGTYQWFYQRAKRPYPTAALDRGEWVSSWRNR